MMGQLQGRVHIVGIGGAGMSGIARVLLARGIDVSGSDAKDSRRLQALLPLGADAYVGHNGDRRGPRQRLERGDRGHQLHSVVRGQRFAAGHLALLDHGRAVNGAHGVHHLAHHGPDGICNVRE